MEATKIIHVVAKLRPSPKLHPKIGIVDLCGP